MTAPLLPASPNGLARAAQLLAEGEVIAFPTDTVYGLAAMAGDRAACERIYLVKRRPAEKALIAMAPDVDAFSPARAADAGRPRAGRPLVAGSADAGAARPLR